MTGRMLDFQHEDNPYKPGVCWAGVGTAKAFVVHGIKGCPLYDVSKGDGTLGTCRMYLCNLHVEQFRRLSYTITKVTEFRKADRTI